MRSPSRISTSSAQVDGQSWGQAEWPILIFECWFMVGETSGYRGQGVDASRQNNCDSRRVAMAQRPPPHMNYRHAYHAGSFADVIKHATVARIIEYLKR